MVKTSKSDETGNENVDYDEQAKEVADRRMIQLR
jgi:hypothetical protein